MSVAPVWSELLLLRMRGLHIDPDDFAHAERLAFHEVQNLCAKCDRTSQCAQDLGDEFADPAWQEWRDYCPNATTLSILSALQSCDAAGR
jgi:hypothetical protein